MKMRREKAMLGVGRLEKLRIVEVIRKGDGS